MSNERPTCESCPYWHRLSSPEGAPGHGECCKSLPRFERPKWPPTTGDCFCGEHPDFPAWIASRGRGQA